MTPVPSVPFFPPGFSINPAGSGAVLSVGDMVANVVVAHDAVAGAFGNMGIALTTGHNAAVAAVSDVTGSITAGNNVNAVASYGSIGAAITALGSYTPPTPPDPNLPPEPGGHVYSVLARQARPSGGTFVPRTLGFQVFAPR